MVESRWKLDYASSDAVQKVPVERISKVTVDKIGYWESDHMARKLRGFKEEGLEIEFYDRAGMKLLDDNLFLDRLVLDDPDSEAMESDA
jgi:hypothetical protein